MPSAWGWPESVAGRGMRLDGVSGVSAPSPRSSPSPLAKHEDSILTIASRSELLAHVSHELRTPLNTVLGIAELLTNTSLTADQRRHVKLLMRAGARLLALADDLLGTSRNASAQASVEHAGGRPPHESLTGVRLLVVDDSEDSRDLLAAFLAGTGAVVAFAGTGAGALDALARGTFDVVLMDLHLPDASGFDVTRTLRRAERDRGARPVAVVALSADVLASTTTRALAAGCSAHLAKPITRGALLDAIEASRRPSGSSPSPALREQFLAHRAREVVTARAALRRGDFELLTTLGHNLRGNGVTYGFPRLSILGRRIESAAVARHEGDLDELLAQLAAAVADAAGGAEPRAKALSGTHVRRGTGDGR